MVFSWWRNRRRRKILKQPFPEAWNEILERNFALFRTLDEHEQELLRRKTQIFIAEKYWEGAGGLVVTEEMQVTIAAQACLLVLGMEHELFERLLTVLVYPEGYFAPNKQIGPAGLVTESTDLRLGEAWSRGPVILSWSDVLRGGRIPNDGQNVVFHEFAHVLDMHDQYPDGIPALDSVEELQTWQQVMTAEYNRLVRHSARRRATLLDHYGAENEAEFFAVATECFFEKPAEMSTMHPRLYKVLCGFYRQDPAARVSRQFVT